MSIFSTIFGGGSSSSAPAAPAPQAAAPAPTGQGNVPATPTITSDPNNPNAPATTQTAEPNQLSGLDQFTDLWKPVEQSPQAQAQAQAFNVDPKKLLEAAGKVDFAKVIPQESLQAISQGGPDAVQAFAQAMNKVAQTVYAQSALATSKIVEQQLGRAKGEWQAELPTHIKSLNVSEALRADNPIFNHPAASPILGALQQQLTIKHPNATSSEIAQMAKTYLGNFASANGQQSKSSSSNQAASDTTDWSAFLN